MNAAALVALDLLLGGVPAFALAWALSRGSIWLFRPAPGRAHLALVALPYVKVVVDVARGVPPDAFLWLRSRGVPQELGSFRAGIGLSWGVPNVRLALAALSRGVWHSESAADLLAAVLVKRVAPWAPGALAVALLAVAAARLARRWRAWARAARQRRALARDAEPVETHRVGRRAVRVLVTSELEGSPFTSGVLAPFIVVPRSTWDAFTADERRAAIAHELAHVAEHHLVLTTIAGAVRDLLWFVPFAGAAERALAEACELAADARAVDAGVSPAVLASALVRVRETVAVRRAPTLATLAANRSALVARVARLVDGAPPPRFGFQFTASRVALTAWLTATVIVAVVLGNR